MWMLKATSTNWLIGHRWCAFLFLLLNEMSWKILVFFLRQFIFSDCFHSRWRVLFLNIVLSSPFWILYSQMHFLCSLLLRFDFIIVAGQKRKTDWNKLFSSHVKSLKFLMKRAKAAQIENGNSNRIGKRISSKMRNRWNFST